MDDFLTKPILRPALANMLFHWLDEVNVDKVISNVVIEPASTSVSKSWGEVTALKYFDNDPVLLADMINILMVEIPDKILDIERALKSKDLSALADAAHIIYEMVGHFSADQLRTNAARLEEYVRNNNVADLDLLTKVVIDSAMSLIAELNQRK
jgi:HPt (histidine-containing phosphotransfer) domain-containing protein